MRTPKRLIISIHGVSCTGKTSAANTLAEEVGCPVLSVGEAVKQKSAEMGCLPKDLTLHDHRQVDDAARRLAQIASTMVIEGTFLDALLADVDDVASVELTCEQQEREVRFLAREGRSGLDARDKDDQALRLLLHGNRTVRPNLIVDTTRKTPRESAREILEWLKELC